MKKVVLIGLGFLLFSCLEQGECSDVSSNIFKVGFYNHSGRGKKSVELDSVLIVGADTILYRNKTVDKVSLPLNPEWEAITFELYSGDSVTSLEVKYSIKTFALAPNCAAIELYTVTEATAARAKEILFKQREMTRNDDENLKLYF